MTKEIGFNYDKSYYESHYGAILNDEGLYGLLAEYWKYEIFTRSGIGPNVAILDYGGGLGQISAALSNVTISDPSAYAAEYATKRGRTFIADRENIPRHHFDIVLSSHSLEHTPRPADDLMSFHDYVKDNSLLVLIVPSEYEMYRATRPLEAPRLTADLHDQHLYCWTFQTITNLLMYCRWKATMQRKIYGPFMLRTLAKVLSPEASVVMANHLGRYRRNYPSLLTVARSIRG